MHIVQHKHTNKLINESSPYLLQHAHNPVNWYPWGDEALEKAKKENKLIIISVGYAACHWCHVMEQESFEDEEVAKLMNDHFVSIKVDREERPDIDQVYMNAVQLLTGSGGWPLNCIALPDGRPIYGGTYFKNNQWLEVLKQLHQFYISAPGKAEEQATLITNGIVTSEKVVFNTDIPKFSKNDLDIIYHKWKGDLDFVEGGQNRAPKFPLPVGFQYLLQYNDILPNSEALKAVTLTLDKMAAGGIYDQIGGGFARYSVDAQWKVPHFEKMLYDNAQLVSLYTSAYQVTKKARYKEVVYETLAFVDRELSASTGGFYSSLDADSEGQEGKFYSWTKQELETILESQSNLIAEYFQVTEIGNWEHGSNILHTKGNEDKLIKKYNISKEDFDCNVSLAKRVLRLQRDKRVRPALDDKILTAWNGLMLKAYIDAYRVFSEEDFLQKALENAMFLAYNLVDKDGRLSRSFKEDKKEINAFLDDYAFTVEAYIALYQATFDLQWLNLAKELTDYALSHFYDENTSMFFYTSDIDVALIARKMEVADNVIPASNSQMAKNLFVLGHYFHSDEYLEISEKMLNNVKENVLKNGPYFSNWAMLMAWHVKPPFEIVIAGENCHEMRQEFDKHYLPHVFFSGGTQEGSLPLLKGKLEKGKTNIYICQGKVCNLPVTNVEDALKKIKT